MPDNVVVRKNSSVTTKELESRFDTKQKDKKDNNIEITVGNRGRLRIKSVKTNKPQKSVSDSKSGTRTLARRMNLPESQFEFQRTK